MKQQSAAIPYRSSAAGVEVCLVTSKRSKRWVLPKGAIKHGMLPHQSASREAYEEAGLIGIISFEPVGIYRQIKHEADDPTAIIAVRAYPLPVTSVMQVWPEMQQRERKWFALEQALEVVKDPEIRTLLEAFKSSLA